MGDWLNVVVLHVLQYDVKGAIEVKIVVGITGASGIPLALRLLQVLKNMEIDVEVALSPSAITVAKLEPCFVEDLEPCDLLKELRNMNIEFHLSMASKLASSSNPVDAVVIVPASMKSVAALANGVADTLPVRVALNAIRLRRRVVIVPRETPLGPIELENLLKLATLGVGIVLPTLAFYPKPTTLKEVVDFIVGKVLDVLGIEHDLYTRYKGL